MDKRKKIIAGVGGVALLLVLWTIINHIRFVKTDNAQLEAHTVMLAPKVSGFVVSVKVGEGERVKKGQVLVEIDPRDYENTLRQIRGEMSSVQARMRDAEKNYRRLSELVSKGAVSSQQFDTSTASYSEVKAKFDAVSAQVAQAEINLQNTQIKAPSDGFIARKAVEEGQLANQGLPLLGFVSAGERWVTANFKETEVADVRIGALALIKVDAISGKTFKGKVTAISPATGATFTLLPPDNATGNFTKVVQRVPVKITLEELNDNDIVALRAGLSAMVSVYKH